MSMAPWTELLASGTSWSKGVGTKLAQLSPLTPTFGTPLAWMGTRSEKVAAQELQGEVGGPGGGGGEKSGIP